MTEPEIGYIDYSAMNVDKNASYDSLKDRVVLITGAGQAIGRGYAHYFSAQGAIPVVADINGENAENVVREIEGKQGKAMAVQVDVADEQSNIDMVDKVLAKYGRLDVLINNAAHDQRHEPEDVTPEYWEERLKLNLNHHFFASQAVQPEMAKAGGGSIINMGSISWHMALEFMPAYTSSKAAIEGLTVSLARSFGKHNIRVNCIVPGQVWTPRQIRDILTPVSYTHLTLPTKA